MRGTGTLARGVVGCARLYVLAAAAAVFALGPASVLAQAVSSASRARLEAAFAEVIADPTDLDKTYAYARLATELGDYEAAITAYERLLLFNPSLPRVKAELGVLYYRLGSFETAKAYLEQALSEGDPPPAARDRIEGFLARIDEGDTRHRFSGSLTAGLRYQSNANFGPEGPILVLGAPALPDAQTAASDDFNVFASLNGRYVYDMGNDAGDFISVEGGIYGARQFDVTELDVEHMRLTAGPGFRLYPQDSGPVLARPHARLTYVRLDDESYNLSLGMGWDFDWQAFDETGLFLQAYAESRAYYATDERPNADTQDGAAVRATVGAIHRLSPNVSLRGSLLGGEVYASEPSEAYQEAGFGASISAQVASPFAARAGLSFLGAPWNLSFGMRYAERWHGGPNPLVSPEVRRDREFRADGTVAIPVSGRWSVFTSLGLQHNRSNIPNNDFTNLSAAIGAHLRF